MEKNSIFSDTHAMNNGRKPIPFGTSRLVMKADGDWINKQRNIFYCFPENVYLVVEILVEVLQSRAEVLSNIPGMFMIRNVNKHRIVKQL